MKAQQYFGCLMAFVALVGVKTANAQSFSEWLEQENKERQAFAEAEKADFAQMAKERDEAIKKMDEEFTEFLKKEWKNYQSQKEEYKPVAPKPDQEPVYQPVEKAPVQLKVDKAETTESFLEMPRLPFMQKSGAVNFTPQKTSFNFYGNSISISFDPNEYVAIGNINEQAIGNAWNTLCNSNYDCTIGSLIATQKHIGLNDWGFYQLARQASSQIAKDRNSQVLLTWFLMTKANYKARLAFKDNSLFLLVASANNIYGKPYFTFGNQRYYMIDGDAGDVFTYDQDFPESRTVMDLNIYKPMNGAEQARTRNIAFEYDGNKYNFEIKYDQNTINFYNDYPQSDIKIYFDATMGRSAKESLQNSLMPAISGMDAIDATSFLLAFVQSFDYQTDDMQFGHEKFFFPDEMFHYQYSDCEDRAVLFAYLVKRLIGLDVIGLNYPGHMATAVCFGKDVAGDFVEHDGRRYTICDPTYIGAPVGSAMPQFAQASAKIIENATKPNLADRAGKLWKIANKYGLYQGDNCKNIVFDADENAYMCGYFNGTINFMGRQMTAEATDIFLAKITADNSLDFLYRIGSKGDDIAYNIILGNDDSFYFNGSFNNDITIAGQTLKSENGDMFIAKCSRKGQLDWINQANIGQLDSVNNTYVALFDNKGKRLWTRNYAESEDFTDYGISVDGNGNAFLVGSLAFASGLMNKSYESMAIKRGFVVSNSGNSSSAEQADPGIVGLLSFIDLINSINSSLQGSTIQKEINADNPDFKTKSPEIYKRLANVEFIKNGQNIVTVRTSDGNPVDFNHFKLSNNSKFKISVFNSGNAQVDFLSGSEYNDEQTWLPLNAIKLYKTSGNVMFDYDIDHTQKTMNAQNLF